ncbi:Zinc finger, RING-type [Corchorus capsularis]|uniref:RING-type E3 ubiquitin transferase n=1 Tax=Corchorus capsularis TaxID=210143 RepID=A0A1R3JNP9_COCAP|nr:Zinc finger, RING-type [Corchorus capsularis]
MSSEIAKDAIHIIVMAIVIAVILLFLSVGMLVILHVCVVGRAFRRNGFGGFNLNLNPAGGTIDRSNNSSNNISMSLDDLQKLPCYDYNAKDKGSNNKNSPVDCAVCLENFKMGEKCRLLPLCRHSFHAECVDSWLLKNPICPICRTIAVGLVFGEEITSASDFGASENVVELRESQSRETSEVDEVRIEVRDSQIVEGR